MRSLNIGNFRPIMELHEVPTILLLAEHSLVYNYCPRVSLPSRTFGKIPDIFIVYAKV